MRVRLLAHAVLSHTGLKRSQRKLRLVMATAAVGTIAAVTPIVIGAGNASADLSGTTPSADVVQVNLSAPATVTRGATSTLTAAVSANGVGVPAQTVQFVSRSPGTATWQVLGSATTGADGTTTLPLQALTTATEFGAYDATAPGVVDGPTATAVVHVIDMKPAVPSVVAYNTRVRLAGHLLQDGSRGLAAQRVQVKFRPAAASAWSHTQWVTTDASGVATLSGRFTRTFQVGIQFPGATGLAPSPLVVRTVKVRPRAMTAANGFRFPFLSRGMVTSPGSWSLDQGVDIFAAGEACGAAAKLVAVGNGTVIQTGISGFGPTAPVIRMSSGPFAGRNVYYGHTGRIYVHVGQHVHAGDLVAQIGCGSVGMSSAPHLEIGVGVPGGPPCCPGFGQTAGAMYRQLVAALRNA